MHITFVVWLYTITYTIFYAHLQNFDYTENERFYVLKVNEDNIQMSEFIEKTLSKTFENGRAFYEFSQMDEDLLSYKEVVQMPKVFWW